MKRDERVVAEKEESLKPEKKEKVDWAAQYGLVDERKEVCGGYFFGVCCYEDRVSVAIYRSLPLDTSSRLPDEDGLSAIDLMFSGKLEITRSDDGLIRNWRPIVNSISIHHPNHFGPQRGLVIADMVRLLSLELISIENSFRKHFFHGQ